MVIPIETLANSGFGGDFGRRWIAIEAEHVLHIEDPDKVVETPSGHGEPRMGRVGYGLSHVLDGHRIVERHNVDPGGHDVLNRPIGEGEQ